MTIKSKIDIDVDANDFRAFAMMFDKYRAEMAKSSSSWASVGSDFKALAKTAASTTKALGGHLLSFDKVLSNHKSLESAARTAGGVFNRLARDTAAVADNLARSTISLLNIATLTGAVGGLIGIGGGLFGLDQMAYGVNQRRRTSLGLGVSYGAMNAFDLNFGRFGDASSLLGGVAGGLYDYTSPAYTALLASGATRGQGGQGDAAQVAIDLMKRLPSLFAGVPEGMVGPKAKTLGITQIMGVKEIVAYLRATPEERRSQIEHYEADTRTLGLSKDAQIKWSNFSTALSRAGIKIETIFAEKLSPLADPLTHLSDSMVKVIDAFSKSPVLDEWLGKAEDGLQWLGSKVGSEEFKHGAKSFLDGIDGLLPVVKKILELAGYALRGVWYTNKLLDPSNPYNPSWSQFGNDVMGNAPAGGYRNPGPQLPSIRRHTRRWAPDGTANSERNRLLRLRSIPAHPTNTGTGTHGIDAVDPNPGSGFWWEHGQTGPSSSVVPEAPITGLVSQQGETTQQLAARIQQVYPTFTNQQCVELARKTAGISAGVWDWQRGSNVMTARPPIGTPVATFMDRAGNPSEYYDAHQGVGAPGNNTTHVGVIAGYTADGVILANQWTGSGGVQYTEYKTGDVRGGEKDASNYFAVDVNGLPAGTHNPYRTEIQQAIANQRFAQDAQAISAYSRSTYIAEDPSIIARRKMRGQQTSMLDHYNGLRRPRSVEVFDQTHNSAVIVSSSMALA